MEPVNYVGDRNTREIHVLSLLRVRIYGDQFDGRMLDRKEEKKT